jgi:hypothetical protein
MIMATWIKTHTTTNHTYGKSGQSIMFKTAHYFGPFEDWSEAVRHIEDAGYTDVEVHEFDEMEK